MKIVIGINDHRQGSAVLTSLKQLDFCRPDIHMIHILQHLNDEGLPFSPADWGAQDRTAYVKALECCAEDLLLTLSHEAREYGFGLIQSKIVHGYINNTLIDYASHADTDLIALGSADKSSHDPNLLGSVGRKVAISFPGSTLIVKAPIDSTHPFTVVLATDHSAYANRCIETFLAWKPKGIKKLVLVSVYPEHLVRSLSELREYHRFDNCHWLDSGLEQANSSFIPQLQTLGCHCKSRVEVGYVSATLARVMMEEQGDLLIQGAQGQGYAAKHVIGSVAAEQSLHRPYSSLTIRPNRYS